MGLSSPRIAGYAVSGRFMAAVFLLILAPDLSMLGYLAGPRVGAIAYNLFHTLIGRRASSGAWFLAMLTMQVALIWLAHIAIDRALGYGLKLPTGSRHASRPHRARA